MKSLAQRSRTISLLASLFIVLMLVPSAEGTQTFFQDDFDGTAIDSTKWNTDIVTTSKRWCSTTVEGHHWSPGNWQDVEVESCHGVTQAPPYGAVTVSGGQASFSAGYLRTFPYIWAGPPSRPSPFPATDDFILEIRMRYDSLRGHGDGLVALFWENTDPVGDNPPIPGGLEEVLLLIWADAGEGCRVITLGETISVSDPLAFHDYRLEYIGGEYSLYVDDTLRVGPTASSLRPNTIWMGNPVLTHWGVGDWSDFTIDFVRVTSKVLNVPHFKQNDPRWGGMEYDDGNSQSLWCGTTMTDCGCATSSAAMLLAYYGVTHAPLAAPVALETNPATLNMWLSLDRKPMRCKNKWGQWESGWVSRGYICGDIDWERAVPKYSADAYQVYGTQMIDFNGYSGYNASIVREDINYGSPVILQNVAETHWFVATGIAGATFTINDPLFAEPYLPPGITPPGRIRLDDPAYGNDANVMVRYIRTASDFSAIVIAVVAPGQVLITDPNGKQTGFDPATSTVVQEIPNSTYFFQQTLADSTGQTPPPPAGTGSYRAGVHTPQAGSYKIEIVSPSNEPFYSFALYAYDRDASQSLDAFAGKPVPGVLPSYTFTYDPTPGATTIVLQIPIDIKPGSDPNCVHNDGHGVIPVAILTTDTFDAATVNPLSVTLDSAGVRVKGKSGNAGSLEDVNGDGLDDLVVQIEDENGIYQEGDTIATLSAETFDGLHIQGKDTICIVP